jgi:hypothetical protein
VLYTAIAISGWLVWGVTGFGPELWLWAGSLLLNAAWSWLFFGKRRMDLAFWELCVFWLSIAAVIAAFAPVHAGAAWLLVPYLCWVTFAGFLNWTLWKMNPAENGAPRNCRLLGGRRQPSRQGGAGQLRHTPDPLPRAIGAQPVQHLQASRSG